jgi:hypothetical protein
MPDTPTAETVETDPPTPQAPVPQNAPQEPPTGDEGGEGNPSREAAKYRRQLREAEAQRDTNAARVESLQRAAIDRIATDERIKPAAMWAAGATLADLLDDDGMPDVSKVRAAVAHARETLGVPEEPRPPAPNPAQGSSGGGAAGSTGVTWSDAIRKR